MPIMNRQLFTHFPTLRARDIMISATDGLQTPREKLARIVVKGLSVVGGVTCSNR